MEDEVGQYVEEGLMVRRQTSDVRCQGSERDTGEPGVRGGCRTRVLRCFCFFFLVFVYQQDSVFLYNKRHIEYTRVLRGAHALVMRKSVRNFCVTSGVR